MKSTRRAGGYWTRPKPLARLACIFLVAGRFIYHQREADDDGLIVCCFRKPGFSFVSGPLATARKAASNGDADHLAVCFPARRRPTRVSCQVGATRCTLLYGTAHSIKPPSVHVLTLECLRRSWAAVSGCAVGDGFVARAPTTGRVLGSSAFYHRCSGERDVSSS
jgi:hypothetical protein